MREPRERLKSKSELAIDTVNKYIDAEISYCETLLKQLNENTDKREIAEICWSVFVDLAEIYSFKKFPRDDQLIQIKYNLISHLEDDLKEYKTLKKYLNNIDHLYLVIACFRTIKTSTINATSVSLLQLILSPIYTGQELAVKAKKMKEQITKKNLNAPIMSEINHLNEMLKILKPGVTSYCLQFEKDCVIDYAEPLFSAHLDQNVNIRIYQDLPNKLEKLKKEFLQQPTQLREIITLIVKNERSNRVRFTPLSTDVNTVLIPPSSTDINTVYVQQFETIKIKYEIEERVKSYFRVLNDQKTKSFPVQATESLTPNKQTNTFHSAENEKPELGISPQHASLANIPEPAAIHSSSDKSQEDQVALSETIVTQEEKQPLEIPGFSALPENPVVTCLNSVTIIEQNRVDNSVEIPDSKAQEPETLVPTLQQYLTVDSQTEKEIEPESASSHYKQAFFPKKDNPLLLTNTPTINLSKTQRAVFLALFDSRNHDPINLRDLINLAQALGGELKTSGANRCRIEIKNIYAHLLLPEKSLKACQKATVTMHGGGHRSSRSQNSEKAGAPGYLIAQFRAAFERAGYTPASLALESESLTYTSMGGK